MLCTIPVVSLTRMMADNCDSPMTRRNTDKPRLDRSRTASLGHRPALAPASGRRSRGVGWSAVLLIAATICAYANSLDGVFVLDDEPNIQLNEHIRHFTPIWDVVMHRRRPVVNLSLAINYAISQDRVWSYHVFNLVVHVLAGLTLFGLVRRTLLTPTFADRFRSSATWLALAVALLWTLHPLQTQSVTYIIQRGESLMGLFYLLTLYCVVRGACSARGRAWFAAAVVACALGMGSKSVMVTAPLMVVVFDRTFLSSTWSEMIRKRWALYVGLIATWSILVATGVVRGVLFPPSTGTSDVGFGYTAVSPMRYALTQAEVLLHYLRLSIWPSGLCLDYGWSAVSGLRDVWPAATVVLALLVATAWGLFRRHWLGFVGAWFFVILAPTSSFIPIKDLAFEHRMYLSLAAVVVLAVVLVKSLLETLYVRTTLPNLWRGVLTSVTFVAIASALGAVTVRRNDDYRSRLAMWADVVAKRPNNPRGHVNLGNALFDRDLDRSIAEFKTALRIDPTKLQAHHNLGNAALRKNDLAEAIREFRIVVKQDPERFRAWYNLGNALYRTGDPEEAIAAYHEVLRIDPDHIDARCNLGLALHAAGRSREAVDQYDRVLQTRPEYAPALYNRGLAQDALGREDDAIASFHEAIRANPNGAAARYALGRVLGTLGRYKEAIDALRQAVRIDPSHARARYLLGVAQLRDGRVTEAVATLRIASRMQPDNANIRESLQEALSAVTAGNPP